MPSVRWQSGYTEDCKSLCVGSSPAEGAILGRVVMQQIANPLFPPKREMNPRSLDPQSSSLTNGFRLGAMAIADVPWKDEIAERQRNYLG